MSGSRHPNPSQGNSRIIRFIIALVFALLASVTLLGGVWAKRPVRLVPNADTSHDRMVPQGTPTPDPQQTSRGASPYPNNLPHQTSQAFAPEPAGSQVYINFDDVPAGTHITNQYPPAIFSTDPSHYTFARGDDYWGSSFPNNLDRGPFGFPVDTSGYAPLYVTFTSPVNNLRFYLLAVDELRSGIAQLSIFQNGSVTATATRSLNGRGTVFAPLLVDIGGPPSAGGMGYENVTRIEIVNITDYQGVAFDDFSFTIAPPATPTPTPSPSPTPFAPTNLHGEGHIEEITLVWDLEPNTTGYNVKRRASFESSWTTIATGVQPTAFASFGNTALIGRYRDNSATPDINYSYAVTALNSNGESPFSNIFSAMLEPSCGNFQPAEGPVQQPYPDPGNGWSLSANTNGTDGLVMSDIHLKNRYMAKMISVPYFVLKTNKMVSPQRGELTANGDASTMRARLLRYSMPYAFSSTDGHVVQQHYTAEYAIDRLTPTSKSCLLITQDYVFNESNQIGDKCEPSASVPCARFYPKVSYKFKGRAGETLESLNVAQRLHYRVDGIPQNSIGVFRDSELLPTFADKANPATVEGTYHVIKNGRDAGSWDNLHQTQFDKVDEPPADPLHGVFGGCPDCVHTHWRWGGFFSGPPYYYRIAGYELIGNNPSFFFPTNQDVDIGLVRYRLGEEHPTDFRSLANNESLRNLVIRGSGTRSRTRVEPADVLYWYSATSYEPEEDLFFKHGSWFNPEFQRDVNVQNATAAQTSSGQSTEDGVRSITYGHTYKDGATAFTNLDPNTLPPLPAGYAALDNRAYKISSEAIVSGPHIVYFDVPSITDQTVFNNLAIFHLEKDPFDPDNSAWVDDTILSPGTPAPDFANRILSARVNDVGYFAIGVVTQPQPDPGNSDLSISVNHSASTATVEDNVSYTLHVANAGPQASMGVGVVNTLPLETTFASVSSTLGTCKYDEGTIYCKLGTIAIGGSVDITIVAKTIEDKTGIQQQGRTITNTSVVAGSNTDLNLDNNSVTDNITLMPNPNPRPNVTITSPVSGTSYSGAAANINIAASTSGNISRVDFYDGSTLIGTASGSLTQYQLSWNATSGAHTIVALATATNGRINTSDPVNVFVNGAATISITSPGSNSVVDSNANLAVTATTSGPVTKVEFFANWISLGQASGGNPYSLTSNLQNGNYSLTAVATDSSGAITVSAPVNISVTSRPSVTIASPVDGMTYPVTSRVAIMATAKDSEGFISKVDFYANGSLIGTSLFIGQDRFSFDWTDTTPGIYSITAVATNNLGVSGTSQPISIGIDSQSPQAGEFIWFDDDSPTGAAKHGEGDTASWDWVFANPGPFSGSKSHQSRNFGQIDPPNGVHKHYFDGATATLPVNAGDKLFTYVFLDINNMPREIMLEWKDANGWEHRAYWGQNNINLGTDATDSRRYRGALPKAGTWARLEVPANLVGLEGSLLNGMSFALDGGRATFDLAGKATANAAPPPTTPPGDTVWVEDAPPAGATTNTINDVWDWVPNLSPYGLAHRSFVSVNHNSIVSRSHYFTGAQTPLQVNPGDVLFTYVWMDPAAMPGQIMLQWYDGSSWEHRAFWSSNFLGSQFPNSAVWGGVWGTESQRYMGGLPTGGSWYRLEVPASYVGLEGKSVTGMAFSVYGKEPTIAWDRSGKASQPTAVALPLSATAGVWRLFSNNYGYAFETNDQGPTDHFPQKKDVFFVHPNQAAGTVPMYRFRRPDSDNHEYFYAQSLSYDGNGWVKDGVAFYVFPDGSTPGTAPLYLYQDNQSHYLLTTNQSDATGPTAIWGYVYPGNPQVPMAPSQARVLGCYLNWRDNSPTEAGFRVEQLDSNTGSWNQLGAIGPNLTSYCLGPGCNEEMCVSIGSYRVQAFNAFGNSGYSNISNGRGGESSATQSDSSSSSSSSPPDEPPPDTAPDVNLITRANSQGLEHDLAITSNTFDVEGAGTIVKVEFFANGSKLGEITDAPYTFVWNLVPVGTYSLTATATDNAGVSTTSAPATITVTKFDQSITFDSLPNKTYGDVDFAVSATTSSGLAPTFSVASGPATISGNTVHITGAGDVVIRASQAGDANYNAAPDVDQYFAVAKASQTITFSQLANKTYGDGPFAVSASGGGSGNPVTFSSGGNCTAGGTNGSTITIIGAGSCSVAASQGGDSNYNAAPDVVRQFTVSKATPTITWNNPADIVYGTALSATQLNATASVAGTLTYTPASGTVLSANDNPQSLSVSFTPTDSTNYTTANKTVQIRVLRATPVITWNDPSTIVYGTALTSVQLNATASFGGNGLSGSFVYTPPAGTVLNAGSGQVLSTTFTPTDSANFSSATRSVHINVNAPPTVSITSPTSGAGYTAPAVVTISASASDSDGSVAKVEFYQGSTKLGEDTTAPFSLDWTSVAAGSYVLTAKATDNLGATTTSGAVTISVNAPPSVTITAPSPGFVGNAPASFTITANASDSDGSVSKVDFYQGTTLLGTDTSAPYSYAWNNVSAATYTLTAKATDNLGAVTTSTAVIIIVNAPPTVSLTSPPSGSVFFAPAIVGLGASASDTDGTISKVEFFQGATSLGALTASPFGMNWNNVPYGTYTITAVATDNFGATTTSAPITVIVDSPPSVTLTSPTNNATFNSPASITMGANASDVDGNVVRVEFWNLPGGNGGAIVCTATTAPYSCVWSNVGLGTYTLAAKAIDNLGGLTTSSSVTVTVSAPTPTPTPTPTPYNSISLNGTTGYMQAANSTSLNINGTLTIEAWVKPNSSTGTQTIISKGTDSAGGYRLSLVEGQPTFELLAADVSATGMVPATTGVWHHVAGVFTWGSAKVYLDGQLGGQTGANGSPWSNSAPLTVGMTTASGSAANYFNGLIDEVRISNVALYSSNFSPAAHQTSTSSTKGLWKFDGQTATDSSGNSNTGTLNGSATYSSNVPPNGTGNNLLKPDNGIYSAQNSPPLKDTSTNNSSSGVSEILVRVLLWSLVGV